MNKGLTILVVLLVAAGAVALWRSQSPAGNDALPLPSISILPQGTDQASPTPSAAAQKWLWHQGAGYRVAYPAIFADVNTKVETGPLGASGQEITFALRALGPRGYLAVGVIDRPFDPSAPAVDGEPVRNQIAVDTPLGKGIRFEMGDQECGATIYYTALDGKTLRIGFAACNDNANRLDRDFELQTGILSTLERRK